MSVSFAIYLISLVNNINISFSIITGMATMGLAVSGVGILANSNCNDDDHDLVKSKYYFKNAGIVFIISMFICTVVPSEKTMYLMIGARYLQNSLIPSKVENILNKKLDEYLTEDDKKVKNN